MPANVPALVYCITITAGDGGAAAGTAAAVASTAADLTATRASWKLAKFPAQVYCMSITAGRGGATAGTAAAVASTAAEAAADAPVKATTIALVRVPVAGGRHRIHMCKHSSNRECQRGRPRRPASHRALGALRHNERVVNPPTGQATTVARAATTVCLVLGALA